jgi:hypothetical protein
MYYIKDNCPVCRTGVIGIRRCADGHNIVLMCDECETVWASPMQVSTATALEAVPPSFDVQELAVAIAGGAAAWATHAEVTGIGWDGYVAGEQPNE